MTIAAYSGGLAFVTGFAAARGRALSREHGAAVVVVEVGSIVQLLAAIIGLAGGHEVRTGGVLAAYLAASVMVLPILWPAASTDDSPWGAATLALALIAIAVISVRALDVWNG